MALVQISRLIKSEDLNHHGTLFAGRGAEWFVESCFICGANATKKPENIVCKSIHGMDFKIPGNKGEVIKLESRLAKTGRTSFVVYSKITKNEDKDLISEGYITFVFIDNETGKPMPHGLVLEATTDAEDLRIREGAEKLR